MNNDLKEIRQQYKISMTQASIDTGIPIRTYSRYENDSNYGSVLKREAIVNILNKKYEITEDKGILNIDDLRAGVLKIIANHLDEIDFCYLFGSYAKGYAAEKSDIDLCVSTSLTGLSFIGFIEELRTELKKKVEVLRLTDVSENAELLKEIMKDGIKIYG